MQFWARPPMKPAFLFRLASLVAMAALLSCQSSGGHGAKVHLNMHPSQKVVDLFFPGTAYQRVVPYEVSLYGIHILQNNLNWRDVETYILWYFDHLNYPDKYGLTGSIYDYALDSSGGETSTDTYDSADAYAATFIMLLHAYYEKVGNTTILNYYQKQITDIAYLMLFLQDNNGLTNATPHWDAQYLMDNCEVYAGLQSFIALAKDLDWSIPDDYRFALDAVKRGIQTKLYDPSSGMFHWAVVGETVHPSQWDMFYPDALSQLFPIIYEIIDPSSSKARRIWNTFYTKYGMGEGVADHLQSLTIGRARARMWIP